MLPPDACPSAPTAPTRPPARRPPAGFTVGLLAALASCTAAAPAAATDLPPGLVADFTRSVQPLLLNKCAAGACHGGASAHAPRFQRGGVGGHVDRGLTLANIATLDETIRSAGSASAFLATISARHPAAGAASSRLELAPLTPAERAVLERWITAASGRRPRPFTPVAAAPITPFGGRTDAAAAVANVAAETPSAGAVATTPAASPEPPAESGPAAGSDGAGGGGTGGSGAEAAGGKRPRPATVAARPNRFRALLDAAANPPVLPPPEAPKGVLLRDTGP